MNHTAGGLYLRKTYNLGRRDTRGKFMSLSTMELDEDPNGHGYYDGDVTDDVDLSGGEGPLQMGEI